MKTLGICAFLAIISCAPMPPADTHRDCCADYYQMRDSRARERLLAESLVVEKQALKDTIRIKDNKIYELQWMLRGKK